MATFIKRTSHSQRYESRSYLTITIQIYKKKIDNEIASDNGRDEQKGATCWRHCV